MNSITTDEAPKAPHLLSQAMVSNGLIFVSGQVHQAMDGSIVQGSVAEKLDVIMSNIKAILTKANSSLDKIVNITIYVTDMAQMIEINEQYPKYFTQLPARAAIGVTALPLGATIEIVTIAEA